MCFFLTVAVRADHAHRIGEVFGRGFQTHATSNPSVSAALPKGHVARLVTSGMCSCDLYRRPSADGEAAPTAHLRRRYEKLGWSDAKIRRALDQRVAGTSKRDQSTAGLRDDVIDRLATLCRVAGSVAVLVHWYDGEVESERLSPGRAHSCDCHDLVAQAKELAEDEVLFATTQRLR